MTQVQNVDKLLLMVEESKYPEFGQRVSARMEALNLTVSDVKAALNVTHEMARRYLMGTAMPRKARMEALADTLKCEASWLAFGPQVRPVSLGALAPWDSDTPLENDEVELPLYKEVEFQGGSGATHSLQINGKKLRFALSTLRGAGVDPSNAACGTATGDSMEPYIKSGATVGIDVSKTQIIDGETYAINHDGLFRIKYVYRVPGGGLRFRSENSDEHPDEFYSQEEVQKSIVILGWVWFISSVRRWKGS